MARKQPIELFMPPNMLKAKVGGGLGGPDMAAIKRAEEALTVLQSEFAEWIAKDVESLTDARTNYAEGQDAAARNALLRAALDIKGQAATFHYPLVARVAGSLSRLIGEFPSATAIPLHLVDAHVDAIAVIHKKKLQDTNDKTAQALCAELDARVDDVLNERKK
jgi:chemotaxis protein histidine kinase CheA